MQIHGLLRVRITCCADSLIDILIEVAQNDASITLLLLKRLTEKIDNDLRSAIVNTAGRMKGKSEPIFLILLNLLLSAVRSYFEYLTPLRKMKKHVTPIQLGELLWVHSEI